MREVTIECSSKQRQFLAAVLDPHPAFSRIGFGGARGAGKSRATSYAHALVAAQFPGVDTLILRKGTQSAVDNYRDEILDVADQMGMRKAFHYLSGKNTFRVANGSEIQLGFISKDIDYRKYVGLEKGLITLSEATEHEMDRWDNLGGSLRAGRSKYIPRMTGDCNPGGGPGHSWWYERFVDERTRWKGYLWIPANIWDCPMTLLKNPTYIRDNLDPLPDWQRRMWLLGDWDAMSGHYFVIKPNNIKRTCHYGTAEDPEKDIEIPPYADFWAGVDYGDTKPFAVIYMARWTDLWTGRDHAHVFSEIYEANMDLDEQANLVQVQENMLRGQGTLNEQVVYFADPHTGDRKETVSTDTGRTISRTWSNYGFRTHPAHTNARVAGWKLIKLLLRHGVLTIDPDCTALLGEMHTAKPDGWPMIGKNVEDIQQGNNVRDHALDALRYVAVSTFGTSYKYEEKDIMALAAGGVKK